jgi:hypothetical protein
LEENKIGMVQPSDKSWGLSSFGWVFFTLFVVTLLLLILTFGILTWVRAGEGASLDDAFNVGDTLLNTPNFVASFNEIVKDNPVVLANQKKEGANITLDIVVDHIDDLLLNKGSSTHKILDGVEVAEGFVILDQSDWKMYDIIDGLPVWNGKVVGKNVPTLIREGSKFGGQFITRKNNNSLVPTKLFPRIETDEILEFDPDTKILSINKNNGGQGKTIKYNNGKWDIVDEGLHVFNYSPGSFSTTISSNWASIATFALTSSATTTRKILIIIHAVSTPATGVKVRLIADLDNIFEEVLGPVPTTTTIYEYDAILQSNDVNEAVSVQFMAATGLVRVDSMTITQG